jgi:glutamyl-tRNA synthetase
MPASNLVAQMIPAPLQSPEHWEQRYPERSLPLGAEVTRFAPSPTGYVHIGSIYVSLIAQSVSHASGGVFFLRVEDTDRTREVADAPAQLARALKSFELRPDEGEPDGPYGPYKQSERQAIYDTYIAELLASKRAYPCFCSREELAELTATQQATGVPSGYWGSWARCRHLSEHDVRRRLDTGDSYVIRFRAPEFHGQRVSYLDRIRGQLELEENRNDVVIRKTIGLPTYHFAHAVDDHLMRVTTVIRGDEWISSVPLHLQLFDALGFERIAYAHIAPLMKQDGKSRRKLSKRKDNEANVDFYLRAGYPVEGVRCYLRGLANSRLLDRDCADTASEPIRLSECSHGGQLVDLDKLDQICRDWIAGLTIAELNLHLLAWAQEYDPTLADVLEADPASVERALSVERTNTDRPRKDLVKWSDFRAQYGLFLPSLFEPVTDPADERFAPLPSEVASEIANYVGRHYRHDGDSEVWFAQLRLAADACGFAANIRDFKKDPERYRGSIRDVANVIRVLVTGSRQSPDLYEISRVLGADEVLSRLKTLTASK